MGTVRRLTCIFIENEVQDGRCSGLELTNMYKFLLKPFGVVSNKIFMAFTKSRLRLQEQS